MINKDLRKELIERMYNNKLSHYGSCLSCLDTINYLYTKVLTNDDKFILSKGHALPTLNLILEKQGYKVNWKNVHPEYNPENGIFATTGSLGHGLPISVGIALSKKLKKEKGIVYVLCGDGELEEGSNWEALNIAHKNNLNNLVILIDYNKYQALNSIKNIMNESVITLENKLNSFGCYTKKINGHNMELTYLNDIQNHNRNKPHAIILDTIKGYGVKFLENNPTIHVFDLHNKPELYKQIIEDLK